MLASADVDEDARAGPDAYPRHRRQELRKRVGLQKVGDLPFQGGALREVGAQLGGEAGHDGGARDDDGLLVEGGEDVLDQALCHSRCLGPDQSDQAATSGFADQGRGAVSLQDGEDGRVLDARAQDPFQRGVDLGEQAAQPVGGAGDFAGEVVVVSGEHVELGDGLVGGGQGAQGVGHGAGGVGDDERVAGVGLGLAGVEVGDPAHSQAGQVSDQAARVAGDGQRQSADVGGLVDDHQDGAVLRTQFVEQGPQLGFAVGQPLVEDGLAGRGQAPPLVLALADAQAEEDGHLTDLDHVQPPLMRLRPRPHLRHQMPASTLRRPAVPVAGSAVVPLISGLPVPPVPGDTTPRIMRTTGGHSHAGPGGREPHFGATKKTSDAVDLSSRAGVPQRVGGSAVPQAAEPESAVRGRPMERFSSMTR